MNPTTISLRILRFHNCEGCIRKVGIVLHQIDDVELVEFDPVSGNVTLSTTNHPEVIRYAIERKTKKKVIILSQEINPRNQNPNVTGPHHQSTINVQELAESLVRVSQSEGLNNVEFVGDLNSNSFRLNFNQRLPEAGSVYTGDLNSNSFRLNFNQRLPEVNSVYTGDADYEFLTPARSAQSRFSATGDQLPVYGYPPEFYGLCTTCSHNHKKYKCCTIL